MAKNYPLRPPPTPPSVPPEVARATLARLFEMVEALLQANPVPRERFNTWKNLCLGEITKAFGSDSPHVIEFKRAGVIAVHVSDWDEDAERHDELIAKSKTLETLIEALQFVAAHTPTASPVISAPSNGREVFVVHGHDDATKTKVARVLEHLGFSPVILHEQANQGMTIIEKFEKHAALASFAVILLTPDDVGCAEKEGKVRPRARQNVILELGYFIARLGRQRVCVLYSPGVELPSDILGVIYTPLDANWEFALAKELKAAGLAVDFNRLG